MRAFLALVAFALMSVPLLAESRKSVAGDGTVTGALTINGQKFPLTHVYGRKREAWPADAQVLHAGDGDLSCGIVDLIFTNAALSEATIASILQNEYQGSEKIRGVRFVVDGSGKHNWETMFLLQSGAVTGYGVTQTSGSITSGGRYTGNVSCRNEEVTQVRMFDLSFDTGVKVQYARTETETAERIPESRLAQEFLETLPGEWTIVRWLGLGCATASGTLVVGERSSPHAFHGTFHITVSSGEEVEEEVTISTSGAKVHVEGGRLSVPESVWMRDVLDLELWQNLMVGNNATDFVVLRKLEAPLTRPSATLSPQAGRGALTTLMARVPRPACGERVALSAAKGRVRGRAALKSVWRSAPLPHESAP